MAEETVNVNPDGSTTFEGAGSDSPPMGDAGEGAEEMFDEAAGEIISKGTDPAIYLLLTVVAIGILYFLYYRKTLENAQDEFFANLDGEKFNLKLPAEVEEYNVIKKKCLAAGWEAGKPPAEKAASGPHRALAQALMKRSIADIPIVTHIQKESAGMNKLYSNSMCSVGQWKAYQAAEAMISAEVDDVRNEANEIEPGWSEVIWRQAMQYHNMLKQKHEMEQKTAAAAAAKRKEIESSVNSIRAQEEAKVQAEKDKIAQAERLAKELIEQEAREKDGKKAFSSGGGGLKKGFLSKK